MPARTIFSFDGWDRDHPGERPPGDRLDAQFAELLRGQAEIGAQFDALFNERLDARLAGIGSKTVSPAAPELGYGAGGFYGADTAGAAAVASDYAQVSIEWAEHMPDPIPPNVLAINAITGDHWSSRWWANRAATIVSAVGANGLGLISEQLAVVDRNQPAPTAYPPVDAQTTMELVVNGRVFSGSASPAPFTVTGKQVTFTSPFYSISPGDEVIARYRYSVPVPQFANYQVISLYYLASQGQTVFLLSAPDRFGGVYTLTPQSVVAVYRSGSRIMPDDGTAAAGFTRSANSITLAAPAGVNEQVTIDVSERKAPP